MPGEGNAVSDEVSVTSEQDHRHVCPVCSDGWIHANDECGSGLDVVPGVPLGHTWARCPMCEGRDE